MGRIGTRLYEMGQWYPRMVVYDDVHGWNPLPYIGAGEFYLEYGGLRVTLTLPSGFVVAATGPCRTPWGMERDRTGTAGRARASAERVEVITKAEATAHGSQRTPGTKTWRFAARRVRDFAWAAPRLPLGRVGLERRPDPNVLPASAAPWEEANRMAWSPSSTSADVGMYRGARDHGRRARRRDGVSHADVRARHRKAEDQYWVLTTNSATSGFR